MAPVLLLAFGVLMMAAVLISERARRTVVSTSVLFLVAGLLLGSGGLGLVEVAGEDDVVRHFAELALFSILFVDGAQLPLEDLRAAWRLPGRALLVGMPLTFGALALAGHLILGMTWIEAMLVAAILSPTDPVFVAEILGREAVPLRLRRLLSVESGLNDGLALPVVMVLLAFAGSGQAEPWKPFASAGLGVLLGVAVPWFFLWLERRTFLGSSEQYRPLGGLAIAAVLFGASELIHANEFLAAFTGGITLATVREEFAIDLRDLLLPVAEAIKLATLMVFGSILSLPFLFAPGWPGVAFAAVALLASRPLGLVLAMFRGGLSRKEWLAAAWFGPKGFASLLYALLMLHAGLARGTWLFQVAALVIVASIIAHSSTDAMVARVFAREEGASDAAR